MKVLSSKPSIVIDEANESVLGLAPNSSLRNAIRLSLTTYSSYRDAQGNTETWDNISPKVAKQLQTKLSQQAERLIKKEVIDQLGFDKYQHSIFQNVLDSLQEHPDYDFFTERFAKELTGKNEQKLTISHLKTIGIDTLETFEERYKLFLQGQKKLKKSFPNFNKVKAIDEYRQLIEYLASNPLFDKFLKNFLKSLAVDFNRKNLVEEVRIPKEITADNLQNFFETVKFGTTPALKAVALSYLTEEMQDTLSQVYLPPSNLVQQTAAQFDLYYWLAEGHHSLVESFLIKEASERLVKEIEVFVCEHLKDDHETHKNVAEIVRLFNEIIKLIVSLEDDFSKNDHALDVAIMALNDKHPLINSESFKDETVIADLREQLKKSVTEQLKLSIYEEYVALSKDSVVSASVLGNLHGDNLIDAVIKRPLLTEELAPHFLSNLDSLLLSGGELPVTLDLAKGNIFSKSMIHDPLQTADDEINLSPLNFSPDSFHFDPKQLKAVSQEASKYYNMRHVIGLKALQTWDPATDDMLQRKYNRILQPGFMEGDLDAQIAAARLAGEAWLTDVLVPTIETSVWLHVIARLVTAYKVPVESINDAAKTLTHAFLQDHYPTLQKMQNDFEQSDKARICLAEMSTPKAEEKLRMREPSLDKADNEYALKLLPYVEMESNKARKAIRNQWLDQFMDKCFDNYAILHFEKKPVYPVSGNHDFVFLGPPASGKSTLSSKYCPTEDTSAYISCNPDHYRGFHRKNTEEFEAIETEQMFIRTQDSAYLIGELVDSRLRTMQQRANVIIDAMTCKPSYKALFKNKEHTDLVFACYDDINEVVKRAYERAGQEEASLGDKGRYINTTDLLKTHKNAGLNLLLYAPSDLPIKLYDTSGPRNAPAPLIGIVRHIDGIKTLSICYEANAVAKLAAFFNKGRVNLDAQCPQSLFFKKIKKIQYQVDALLSVVKLGCKVNLEGKNQLPCLSLEKSEQGRLLLDIQDPEQLQERLTQATDLERTAIETLILYGHYGDLKEFNKQCLIHNHEMSSEIQKLLNLPKFEGMTTQVNDVTDRMTL